MMKFCENFDGILHENLWNFKKNTVKFWENIGEILKKIGVVLGVNFGEILKKMLWNFEKSLVKSWSTFGEILEKNWWSCRENLVKSWEQG